MQDDVMSLCHENGVGKLIPACLPAYSQTRQPDPTDEAALHNAAPHPLSEARH